MNSELKIRVLEALSDHLDNAYSELGVGIESNSPQAHIDFDKRMLEKTHRIEALINDVKLDWE